MATQRQTVAAAEPHQHAAEVISGGEAADDVVWHLPQAVRLDRRAWDDEVVVFNHASGQTHLLDALSNTALAMFEDRSWTVRELAQVLAADFAVAPPEMFDRLNTIAGEFARLGLLDADAA